MGNPVDLGTPFAWPFSNRPGIRYCNLTEEQIAMLPPFKQQHLPDRAMNQRITGQIANAGVPELTLSDPVLPSAVGTGPGPTPVIEKMRYGSFLHIALNVGLADQLVLNSPPGAAKRIFLLIVNSHPTQNMFLTFGVAATQLLGIPILNTFGFILLDTVCPHDDVHLIANGAATTGMLMFANKTPNQEND